VIVEMIGLDRRLPYKVARRQKYWPDAKPNERWWKVASELDRLRDALASRINGIEDIIPTATSLLDLAPKSKGAVLKGFEDALDAVVCAFVGCEFLKGHATPFGDQESAIWIPCRK
jgi:predicted RNase H-like nuclease